MFKILNAEDLVGEVESNSLIHGDCLNVMNYIGEKSIDLILCDLPYG
jgi:DNA modification methylase